MTQAKTYTRRVKPLPSKDHKRTLVRVPSPVARLGPRNEEFWVRTLIPMKPLRASDGKVASLIVTINGLAESDVSSYDDLAESLADTGIASLMMPLPNHFCRFSTHFDGQFPFEDEEDDPFALRAAAPERDALGAKVTKAILQRMASDADLWIDGVEQSLADVFRIVDYIRGTDKSAPSYFRDHFSEQTRISLYGYSLGGLIALCCVLARWWLFRSAFIVNSGCSLEEIDGARLFGREWKRIQLDILSSYQKRLQAGATVSFSTEFEQVMLGNWMRLRQQRLERLCRRILFVAGANDEVFNVDAVLRMGSGDTGIAFLQLPVIGHMISSSSRPEWERWRKFLAELLAAFEAHRPADSFLEETIELTIADLYSRSPGERIRAKYMRLEGERLVPHTVSPNIVGTDDAKLILPRGRGLCWRAVSLQEDEVARADLGDIRALEELNFAREERETILSASLRLGVAAPVYGEVGGSRTQVGVLAFASDRGEEESILAAPDGIAAVRACAKLLGEIVVTEQGKREPRGGRRSSWRQA